MRFCGTSLIFNDTFLKKLTGSDSPIKFERPIAYLRGGERLLSSKDIQTIIGVITLIKSAGISNFPGNCWKLARLLLWA